MKVKLMVKRVQGALGQPEIETVATFEHSNPYAAATQYDAVLSVGNGMGGAMLWLNSRAAGEPAVSIGPGDRIIIECEGEQPK